MPDTTSVRDRNSLSTFPLIPTAKAARQRRQQQQTRRSIWCKDDKIMSGVSQGGGTELLFHNGRTRLLKTHRAMSSKAGQAWGGGGGGVNHLTSLRTTGKTRLLKTQRSMITPPGLTRVGQPPNTSAQNTTLYDHPSRPDPGGSTPEHVCSKHNAPRSPQQARPGWVSHVTSLRTAVSHP